ncbi:hypothetical protein CQ018_16990 [Arthrobacter sp. MYb227]|uniref:hypothetical protein n=1 Tax=Arthrobacter sp. MYb227 TaxID=1848601 RepID=UPI000CFCD312|nr:hypothetical protein [Arthrobacter sp. MYb227]PQZ88142.1 hypothetical protein CQ018_16990 [Arthrobacter sp. MYb227]
MNTTANTPLIQRALTFIAGGLAIISLIALTIILIQYALSVALSPAVLAIGLYGLPLAFILLMVILFLSFRERRKN